jgi:pimeloyl-ACP methyl ester carboxylesterase
MKRGGALAVTAWLIALSGATTATALNLDWERCGKRVKCATAELPRDYSDRSKGKVKIALTRLSATRPETRIGSLFFNFGGPGFGAVDAIKHSGRRDYRSLNRRYDLIGFDPRGTGLSRPAINCQMNAERASKPLPTPSTPRADLVRGSERLIHRCMRYDRRKHILRYVSTENVVRDLNRLRAAVGDHRLNYFGHSYGTAIGGTFESLYPNRVGRIVLDGPLDLQDYFNQPLALWVKQARSSEDVLDGFLRACKRHQAACSHFGGKHPAQALHDLHQQLVENPIPAGDHQRADGDDLLAAVNWDVIGREYWAELASALRDAENGDGTFLRELADGWWGYLPDGGFDPGIEANLIIAAVDQAWPKAVKPYLKTVRRAYRESRYLWWIGGSTSGIYANVVNGLLPRRANDVYRGPFENTASAPTTLVVATTHDPLTPYEGAKAEVRQLGNARLLTMKGYTHGAAYRDASPCVDRAVNAYFNRGLLPDEGTVCRQRVRFEPYAQSKAAKSSVEATAPRLLRPGAVGLP